MFTKKNWRGLVLVVDDYPTNQIVATEYLKRVGCEVEVAANGAQALEYCKRQVFDLILMDISMPVMDGLEATRLIRKLEVDAKRRTPIVALTASVYSGDRESCLTAGLDGFLKKPIEQKELFSVLDKWLESAESALTAQEKMNRPQSGGRKDNSPYLPETLPGIDMEYPMVVLDFTTAVYRKILDSFIEEHMNTRDNIRAAFAAGDWKMLASLAHNLENTSADIGAFELREAASILEKRCRTASISPADKKFILKIELLLAQVMDSLHTLPAIDS